MPYRLLLATASSFFSAGSFWMFLPLLSVSLRAEGVSDALVGVMSGLPWVGLLAISFAIPRLIQRLGLQRMVLLGMALAVAAYLGFAATRAVPLWAGLCLMLGASLGLRWAGMDTWINGSVPEHARGRLIGSYELLLSGSMAVGPGLLAIIGTAGPKPFIVAAAVVCGAMALLLGALSRYETWPVCAIFAGLCAYRAGRGGSRGRELTCAAVALAEKRKVPITKLKLTEWKKISPVFDKSALEVFSLKTALAARPTHGSPNPKLVKAQLARWKKILR